MNMQHKVGTSSFQPAAGCRLRVQQLRRHIVGIALALCLAACSSNDSSSPTTPTAPPPPPPPAATSVSGTVDDAFVDNATLTAYEVSSTGTIGNCVPAASGSGCATATTDSSGAYTVTLGGSYTGPVLLESTGGSYTDTVTGQTVSIPANLTLSVFLPSVTAGTNTVAQITGFTTVAAQLALQAMSQGASAASASSTASTGVQTAFGFPITAAETATLATALVNLDAPNCGTAAANQASFDVSLLLAGIAQLASQNGVTSAALTLAIIEDIVSDGKIDGLAGGEPILVPLASGNGSIALTTIYGEALALSLEASIKTYESSVADACQATQSPAQSTALTSAPTNLASEQYQYTATGSVSGLTAGNTVSFSFSLDLTCASDVVPGSGSPTTGAIPDTGNGTFSLSVGGSGNSVSPLNYNNSCGTNTGTVQIVSASGGQICLVASSGGSPAASATFNFTDAKDSSGNETDTASGITITCSPATPPPPTLYTVGGTVSQLPAGASVTISDTVNGDNVIVNATGPFTLAAQLGNGTAYQVTASTASPNTCTVSNGSGTINGANVTNVAVACSSAGAPPSALYGPRGIEFHNNLLFVPNYGSNQLVVLSEQTNGSNQVTGLTQVASITKDLNKPARAAFDAGGTLYVANQGNGSGTVTAYGSNYAEITASGGGPLISGGSLTGPIGVALDSQSNVYVVNDPGDTISVFKANTAGNPGAGFTEAAFSPLHNDGAGTSFATPLMVVDENIPGVGEFVIVGLSQNPTSRVLVYQAPLTATSVPIYDLAGVAGCTMPAGPTGIALSGTSLYIGSSYDTEIFEYTASTLIGGGANPCVAPAATNGTGMSGVEGVAVDSFDNVFVANAGSYGAYANTITVYAGSSFGSTEAPLYTYDPIATLACNAAPSPKGGGSQPYDNESYCAMGFTGTTSTSYTFKGTLTFTTPISPGAISNCEYATTGTEPSSPTTVNSGPTACTGTTDASGNLTITDGGGNSFTGTFSTDGTTVTGTYNFTVFGPNSGAATGSFSGTMQ
jgi:hypothetical protein